MMKFCIGLAVCFAMVSLASSIVGAADLRDGLVGYWPLDGNADDPIGGTTGELMDGAEWSNDGYLGGAVMLDGVSGHVVISGFELITDSITFVCWLKGWRQSQWAGIIVSRGSNDIWMGFGNGDALTYVWNNNDPQTYNWAGGPVIPQDKWSMLAVTIDPEKVTAYAYSDGELSSGTNEMPHIEQIVDDLKFGWDECCGADRHVSGLIDEVMIYDRALNEDEILQLATSGLAVSRPDDKLIATWAGLKR